MGSSTRTDTPGCPAALDDAELDPLPRLSSVTRWQGITMDEHVLAIVLGQKPKPCQR